MGISDLTIEESDYETQYDSSNMWGSRNLILDIKCGDTKGRKYDVELEKNDASPDRALVHVAGMVAEHLHPGEPFKNLPELYIIFFCDTDRVGNGRPVTKFSFRDDEDAVGTVEAPGTHSSLGAKAHIIFINGSYKDSESEIGKLIHDFKCRSADDMYTASLADRMREIKEQQKEVDEMCAVLEEVRNETRAEEKRESAERLIKQGKLSLEDIAEGTGLTLSEVQEIAGVKTA